jgi:hypothetical protein
VVYSNAQAFITCREEKMEASGKSESAVEEQAEKLNIPPCPQCGSHKVGSIVKVTEIEAGDAVYTYCISNFYS